MQVDNPHTSSIETTVRFSSFRWRRLFVSLPLSFFLMIAAFRSDAVKSFEAGMDNWTGWHLLLAVVLTVSLVLLIARLFFRIHLGTTIIHMDTGGFAIGREGRRIGWAEVHYFQLVADKYEIRSASRAYTILIKTGRTVPLTLHCSATWLFKESRRDAEENAFYRFVDRLRYHCREVR